MPFRSSYKLSRAASSSQFITSKAFHRTCLRSFTTSCRHHDVAAKNHYERLNIRHDATPAEIKKSFYKLSKVHHPDANPSDPAASQTFSLLSESYTILSDPPRRATYDRDVLRLHQPHHHHHRHPAGASYHSTNPAGGRPPSGLSRRKGTFRGPPPSFYRNGGWGAHAEKRRRAHEESTSPGGTSAAGEGRTGSHAEANPFAQGGATSSNRHGGMGPGSDPFGHHEEVWHFDKQGHERTQKHEDERRWERGKRAVDDDGVEFEPQMSLGGHFIVVLGILATSFVVPVVYLQFKRLGRKKQDA